MFDNGILTELRPDEPNRAKELIEDFMIAANGVVARSPEHWDRIVALNRFLGAQRQAAPASFPDLSLSVIKLLGSGEYQVETPGGTTPGHFGLAVSDYTHSSSGWCKDPPLPSCSQRGSGYSSTAVVTGASDKGTWVRISDPMAEGKVVKGADGMKVGDTVRVQLLDTDAARGFIDFGRTR